MAKYFLYSILLIIGIFGSSITLSGVFAQTTEGSTNDATVSLEHNSIEIGKNVTWTQKVNLATPDSVAIEIPSDAQITNVETSDGQTLDLSEVTETDVAPVDSTVVSLPDPEMLQEGGETTLAVIDETANGFNLSFETPAPYTTEEDTSTTDLYQKEVTVAHDSALHYTDVKSVSDIPEDLVLQGVEFKLYWMVDDVKTDVTNDERFAVTFVDTDGNGIVDQMQWIVPQLSEQQFVIEGIIVIMKAEHLDSARNSVEDVYDQVKERDGIWTSPIFAGDYIRVTFVEPLNYFNDITIFARSNYPDSSIEVYEKDSDILLASFDSISEDIMYKILLSNLQNNQDTFDLKIIGNPIEFDYLVDPADKLDSVTVGTQTGTLNQGTAGSATYLITVTKGLGFVGAVQNINLAVTTTLPAGATASFNPAQIDIAQNDSTGTSTLTISTLASTLAGSYPFTVQASASGSPSVTDDGTLLIGNPTFLVHYEYTGCPIPVTVPPDENVPSGQAATGVFTSPVTSGTTRCIFVSDDRPATITAPTTITGTYSVQRLLTVTVNPGAVGISNVARSPGGVDCTPASPTTTITCWYNDGASVQLTATSPVAVDSNSRYVFTGWSDDLTGTTNPDSVTMDDGKSVTANYQLQHSLTVTVNPGAVGISNVARSPGGVDCTPASPTTTITCWYNDGASVQLTATSPVSVGSFIYVFTNWSGDLTGTTNPDSVTMDDGKSVTANYLTLPHVAVTDQGHNYFDKDNDPSNGRQFRLIFTQNPLDPSTWKETASNPGQFADNVFYAGTPGGAFSLDFTVPYPFVTQGSNPLKVSSGVSIVGGAFVPTDDITNQFTITGTKPDGSSPMNTLSPSGALTIVLDDYQANPLIGVTSITLHVTGTVPSSGLVYVSIHLDYGLKKSVGYFKCTGDNADSDSLCTAPYPIPNNTVHTFTQGSYSDSVKNLNIFKHDPGFAGLVTDSNDNPVPGTVIKIYKGSSVTPANLLGTTTTDDDGVYLYSYKHTGKASTYTINLVGTATSPNPVTVTVKANGFALVDFTVP